MSISSLLGEGDPSGVSDLALLQVLHQLGQPAFGGRVILQHLSKSGVFELVGKALPQSFSGSVQPKQTGLVRTHCIYTSHKQLDKLICLARIDVVPAHCNTHLYQKKASFFK